MTISAPMAAAFAAGLALGALLAWLAVRARREGRLRSAEVRAEAAERRAEEGRLLGEALDDRHRAVSELVRPLAEALEAYRRTTQELEERRLGDLGRVDERLRELAGQTARVAAALRSPHARGRWGEITLRRAAELAGLSAHCDFREQAGDGDRRRPDMRVHLPGGREIVVDAKAPLEGYLAALDAGDDAARARALEGHATALRRHVDALAAREYPAHRPAALDLVVLFLPHDALLAAACEVRPDLVEHALDRGVVFATPSTLFALLAAVARGWQEERLTRGAREVLEVARELQERLVTFAEHLGRTGESLGRAVDHYNRAVGSFESRLLPQARRIRELGGGGARDLPAPGAVDALPRAPRADPPAS